MSDAIFGGGSNHFQAESANLDKQSFGDALGNSLSQFNSTFANQSGLANQLQQQSLGLGPNPAQLMLNQATDKNIQQNAGMLASQKGINPALAQRLAGQNQASMSQQAAGQGALMGAQQQVQAQNSLAGVYGNQANEASAMQGTLQNAQAAQNNAVLGNTTQMNTTNANAAASNAAQQGAIIGGVLQGGGAALAGGKAHGGKIEGKAPVAGDSPKNDTVPAMLSPGEIVIPRSVANDPKKALAFIEAINKKKDQGEDGPSFAHILKKHRELGEALKKHGAA